MSNHRFWTLAQLGLFLVVLTACGAPSGSDARLEEVVSKDDYGNTETYQRRRDNYAREGWYTLTNPQGVVIERKQYANDTLDGPRIIFYDTGDTNIVEHYRAGLFEGAYRNYYEDGTLMQEGRYTDNAMEGEWKTYYPSGQLMETVTFRDNQENGPFIEYHGNGQLKAEGYYRDGDNEDGSLKLYNENGELIRTMHCEKGVCRTVWAAEGEAEQAVGEADQD